jgi:uncharacterized protein
MDEKSRIIIDTSWWISMIASKQSSGLPSILINENYRVCFSAELKEEIFIALAYTRIAKRINEPNMKLVIDFITNSALHIDVTSDVTVCRDPKDNFLLSLAKDASASYLITKDPDLLDLRQFEHTIICTLSDFIKNYLNK